MNSFNNYNPLNANKPKNVSGTTNRFASGLNQKKSNNFSSFNEADSMGLSGYSSNGATQNKTPKNKTQSLMAAFGSLAEANFLQIQNGKVIYPTDTSYSSIGAACIIIGGMTIAVAAKMEEIEDSTLVLSYIIGGIIFAIGVILNRLLKSYAVLDNNQNKIYTESFFASNSIYKNKFVSKNDVLQVAVDHRKIEGSVVNTADAMGGQARNEKREPTESAVALLLKNGTIFYFNSFANFDGAHQLCEYIGMAIANLWNVEFKKTSLSGKLVVKRLQGKLVLSTENLNEVSVQGVMSSVLRICLGVVGFFALMFLVIWLGQKYL